MQRSKFVAPHIKVAVDDVSTRNELLRMGSKSRFRQSMLNMYTFGTYIWEKIHFNLDCEQKTANTFYLQHDWKMSNLYTNSIGCCMHKLIYSFVDKRVQFRQNQQYLRRILSISHTCDITDINRVIFDHTYMTDDILVIIVQ